MRNKISTRIIYFYTKVLCYSNYVLLATNHILIITVCFNSILSESVMFSYLLYSTLIKRLYLSNNFQDQSFSPLISQEKNERSHIFFPNKQNSQVLFSQLCFISLHFSSLSSIAMVVTWEPLNKIHDFPKKVVWNNVELIVRFI